MSQYLSTLGYFWIWADMNTEYKLVCQSCFLLLTTVREKWLPAETIHLNVLPAERPGRKHSPGNSLCRKPFILLNTIIILNIGTDRSEQTVETQIRLLLMEQSDQGLLCLLFCLHLLNTILHCKIQLFQL